MYSYLSLLSDVLHEGEHHDDRTGTGTLSLFGRHWSHNFSDGFPILTTKKIPLRWVFEELRWFLSGSTNVADLQAAGVDIWDEWATPEMCAKFGREPGDLGPVYGALWRDFGVMSEFNRAHADSESVDQIAQLLHDIENTPNSRRLIVTGWHPAWSRQVALPPCHTLWQVKVHHNGEMSMHLYARSTDVFLGLPFNISSYALLLMMLCQVIGNSPRKLAISFGDLHLYKNHIEQAKIQLDRDPYIRPNLVFVNGLRGNTPLEQLMNIRWPDLAWTSQYRSWPKIDAPVSI